MKAEFGANTLWDCECGFINVGHYPICDNCKYIQEHEIPLNDGCPLQEEAI